MNVFFLAYEIATSTETINGWRMFESEATTFEEVAQAVRDVLDEIHKGNDYKGSIIATAFNRI